LLLTYVHSKELRHPERRSKPRSCREGKPRYHKLLVDGMQTLAESADQQRVPVGAVKTQHIDSGFPFGGINNLANPQQGSTARYGE
jgi:hypothetical protein